MFVKLKLRHAVCLLKKVVELQLTVHFHFRLLTVISIVDLLQLFCRTLTTYVKGA